jgi:hypothetical protein
LFVTGSLHPSLPCKSIECPYRSRFQLAEDAAIQPLKLRYSTSRDEEQLDPQFPRAFLQHRGSFRRGSMKKLT